MSYLKMVKKSESMTSALSEIFIIHKFYKELKINFMTKQLFFVSFLSMTLMTTHGLFARPLNLMDEKVTTICSSIDSAEILKSSIHFHVAEVKKSKISTNEKIALEKEYEELRGQINAELWKMSKEVSIFEPNSQVYERYKSELNLLFVKAYGYMDKVNVTLKRKPVGVGSVDNKDLILWLIELANRIKGVAFYNKLKLKSWKDIK